MEYTRIVQPPESRALKSGRVVLAPGEEVGEHVTENKEELLVVMKGKATLINAGETFELQEGETHYIPEGKTHNVLNKTDSELEYVYVVSLLDLPSQS